MPEDVIDGANRQNGRASAPWRRWLSRAVLPLSWGYLGVVVAVLVMLRLAGDLWWPATLILFAPRWLVGLPLVLAVPAALAVRRRALWPLGMAALLWLFPLMGFQVPLSSPSTTTGTPLRVVTLNMGQDRVAPHSLAELVRDQNADLVMLQECPADFQAQWPADWHMQRAGQIVIAARYPLDLVDESRRLTPASRWPPVNGLLVRAHLPTGPIYVACVHQTSPREGLAEVLDRQTGVSLRRAGKVNENLSIRSTESTAVGNWLAGAAHPLLIGGDFNMPVDSRIYRAVWARYENAFSRVGFGFGHTKFEPLGPLEYGIRIDHWLCTGDCQFERCWVGPNLGSDHRPLIADLTCRTE